MNCHDPFEMRRSNGDIEHSRPLAAEDVATPGRGRRSPLEQQ